MRLRIHYSYLRFSVFKNEPAKAPSLAQHKRILQRKGLLLPDKSAGDKMPQEADETTCEFSRLYA